MSNRNSNPFLPIISMFCSFWIAFIVVLIFDDDDKKSTYSQDAIAFKVDNTQGITAQELIDQGKISRAVTFNPVCQSHADGNPSLGSKSSCKLSKKNLSSNDSLSISSPQGYYRGVLSGTEISRLFYAMSSANSIGAKVIAYLTEMEKLDQEQEELSKDMDNATLSEYEETLYSDKVTCYIQKNYLPINSVIFKIYRDRLSIN